MAGQIRLGKVRLLKLKLKVESTRWRQSFDAEGKSL
jgi:hypothetical protein